MALFRDIPQLPRAHYEIDVGWRYVEEHLAGWAQFPGGLDLDPPYQRAHVWTVEQQIAYVEYSLMGGEVGRNLTFNCRSWESMRMEHPVELVDGKQRLTAVRSFMRNELRVFGHLYCEYADKDGMRQHLAGLKFRVCSLQTPAEVLRLYLNINAGGTPHTADELNRVRKMLAEAEGIAP